MGLKTDYSRVTASFWTGRTGRAIRKHGPEAQVVALYLLTCHTRCALGIFYVPVDTIAHETGMDEVAVSSALASLTAVGFLEYDQGEETVWIPEMAGYQIAESLSPTDNRVKWVRATASSLRRSPFYQKLLDRWGQLLSFSDIDAPQQKGLPSPLEGASFPTLPTQPSLPNPTCAGSGGLGEKPTQPDDAPPQDSPSQAKAPPAKKAKADRKKPARAMPDDFAPNATHQRLAKEQGVSLDAELAKFLDFHRAKGSVFADWPAALCTWLRNARQFAPRAGPTQATGSCRPAGTTGGLVRLGAQQDPKLGTASAARAVHGWCKKHPGRAAVSPAGLCEQCRDAMTQEHASA